MEAKSGSKYERLRKIGIGSYGVVFKCVNRQSGQVVAIKRYSENDSDPIIRKIAMREVRMLRQLKHPNLINLIEVFRRKRRLHLVFDYCELTVLDVIERYTSNCPLNLIRKIIWQTINGINYCHTHNCIHRDIKPENILINQSGVVKLCDFGFARSIKSSASTIVTSNERFPFSSEQSRVLNKTNNNDNSVSSDTFTSRLSKNVSNEDNNLQSERQAFTEYVATRWYRAPELLIGEIYYDIKIDIWAIGCVTAELMRGEPLWPGKTDLDQLFTIKSSLGPLTQSQTHTLLSQGIYDQANIERLLDQPTSLNDSIEKKLPARVGQNGIDFVSACLQMDPAKRPTSGELLSHEYIHSARMSQFIQKDHAPTHRLPILGDRTVTLSSLSPTINRTNSQALLLLTSTQQHLHQQRPAKKFVVASTDSPIRKGPYSIPLAISKQQNILQQSRSPIKQQTKNNSKSINGRQRATNGQSVVTSDEVASAQVANAAAAAAAGGFASDKPLKRKQQQQPVKSNNINGLNVSSPNGAGNLKQPPTNMDKAQPSDRSSLPVAKIRSRETSMQRTTAEPNRAAPETNHHPGRRDDRLTMKNAAIDASQPDEEKPLKRRDPTTARIGQMQQQQQRQPINNQTGAQRQLRQYGNGDMENKELEEEEEGFGQVSRENDQVKDGLSGSLKPNKPNKRKTATNDSSASSSNYSDALSTVKSTSIAFLPPVYQDRRS